MKAKIPGRERHVSRKEMNLAVDIFLRVAMVVLIEDFGFGTKTKNGKTPRLQKFVDSFERWAMYYEHNFGQEMLDGINARLETHGVRMVDQK